MLKLFLAFFSSFTVACALLAARADAQILDGDLQIALEEVASGLAAPVQLTHAGDGSGRIFIADQAGQVRIIDANGDLLEEPFLDITDRMVTQSEFFDERGLLGIAFHPDYETNGRFFVRYSAPREGDPAEPCNDPKGFIVGCHSEVLSEFAVSAGDPNVADPDSELIMIEVPKPQFNHNGGGISFGPDGLLYFSLGDGGGANDGLADVPPSHGPIGNGQNLESLLGKVLRIDVDGGSPYAIPDDNPFVGIDGLDEIYAYGLRNPFQFTFDAAGDGTLYLGDVGQDLFEEVDIITLGGNYGWAIKEGLECFDPLKPSAPPATCDDVGMIDPVAVYDHSDGLAVICGPVYRGEQFPDLVGKLVLGDFSRDFLTADGRLFYIDTAGDLSEIFEFQIGPADALLAQFLKGFGQDEAGEAYALVSSALAPFGETGRVLHIVEPRDLIRGDVNQDGIVSLPDVLLTLGFQFLDGEAFCLDAMDFNDDGAISLPDPISSLTYQFLAGPEPPAPFGACGFDTSADAAEFSDLGCERVPGAFCAE